MSTSPRRAGLKLVDTPAGPPAPRAWFCGHCAASPIEAASVPPSARVCGNCGLGLLHQAAADQVPHEHDAFVIIDSSLTVQAISRSVEQLFGVRESEIVNHPVTGLFLPADAEAEGSSSLATAISSAASGDATVSRLFVRPATTFGVRLQARIAACGPPSAALLVLT